MIIGVPKEIKNNEFRVGLTPSGVKELIACGHQVYVQHHCGLGIGIEDHHYQAAGAEILHTARDIFDRAELIVKVKEPQVSECEMLRPHQLLFAYLHLAPDPTQTELLIQSRVTAIAYETVTDAAGSLPLLTPMSAIAGRLSVQEGAHCLEKSQGGSGILLGGVPGVMPAEVCIIGAGIVGSNAAQIAMGMGANVTVLDRSLPKLAHIDTRYFGQLRTQFSTTSHIEQRIATADLVIGAVLIPGATAPKVITRDMLHLMKPGSVLVDVAIDQGGCFETSRATTHQSPTYVIDNITHYCVANMPGAVARTATFALTHATLPHILTLANHGIDALKHDPHLLAGLNVHAGMITCPGVATALNKMYVDPMDALAFRQSA